MEPQQSRQCDQECVDEYERQKSKQDRPAQARLRPEKFCESSRLRQQDSIQLVLACRMASELVASQPLLPYRLDRSVVLALCLWRFLLLRAVALGLLVVRSVLGLWLRRHLPGGFLPLQL